MSVVSGTVYGMRASRILPFARTSRCAMVAVGTRNARAISSVSRPPSVRRVSATWASSASAGWQQVKMRRRRSSGISCGSYGSAIAWPKPAAVDSLVPGRLDDPGPRELGDTRGSPLVRGGGQGLLRRLFGHVEVTDEPDQGGDDPAPIRSIKRVDGGTCIRGHTSR